MQLTIAMEIDLSESIASMPQHLRSEDLSEEFEARIVEYMAKHPGKSVPLQKFFM